MRISVIIPCYNAGDYLLQAIASIKRQKTDFPLELEIIVVDDESEDGSAKRAADAGARGWKLRLAGIGGRVSFVFGC